MGKERQKSSKQHNKFWVLLRVVTITIGNVYRHKHVREVERVPGSHVRMEARTNEQKVGVTSALREPAQSTTCETKSTASMLVAGTGAKNNKNK